MNGFKWIFLFVCLVLSSCVKRSVKEYEGDALFFIYRFLTPNRSSKIYIWDSPEAYIQSNSQSLTESIKLLLKEMDPKSLVFLIGGSVMDSDYFIDNIIYKNNGTLLEVKLKPVSPQIKKTSDLGYPVFIKNKDILSISFFREDKLIYVTNI